MEVKYTAKVFPKGISEEIYNKHLLEYSPTLVSFISEIQKDVPVEYHQFIPYGIYVCPLCLKNHFIKTDSGIVGNSEFSLDHLPPKSAGGSYKIITCKKCNNDSGAFEAELEKALNFGIDKTNSNAGVSIKVNVSDPQTGKTVPGIAKHKNGKTAIKFHDNLKKKSRIHADFFDRLNSNKIGALNINVPLFDSKKVERALLKSAYLLCFVWWGYEFVFSDNGGLIRETIAGKKDYPCRVPLNWLDVKRRTGLSILQDGNVRKAFLVQINLKGLEVKTVATVLIPSPADDGWSNLSIINEINNSNQIKEYKIITLPRIVHRIGYTMSWGLVIPPSSENLS